jgi:LysR family transcriptional regulator, hydrogen peroxide-inducible genes activator
VPQMAIDRNIDCRYVRLSDAHASRTIVAAWLRGRNFNRVQQAFRASIGEKAPAARRRSRGGTLRA